MTAPLRFPMDPDRRAPENALFRLLVEEIQGFGPRFDRLEDRLRAVDEMAPRIRRAEEDVQRIYSALQEIRDDMAKLHAPRNDSGAVVVKPAVLSALLAVFGVAVTVLLKLADWIMSLAERRP